MNPANPTLSSLLDSIDRRLGRIEKKLGVEVDDGRLIRELTDRQSTGGIAQPSGKRGLTRHPSSPSSANRSARGRIDPAARPGRRRRGMAGAPARRPRGHHRDGPGVGRRPLTVADPDAPGIAARSRHPGVYVYRNTARAAGARYL